MRENIPIVAHFANKLAQNELTSGYTRSKFICKWYNFLLILFLIILVVGIFFVRMDQKSAEPKKVNENSPVNKVKFYDEKTFLKGVEKSKEITKQDYKISGGIVPHHLFPGFMIADFFKRLSYQNPKTIILIGPNHYEKGNFKALTSLYGWETPYGLVNPDLEIINRLLQKNLVEVDEEVLVNDHAVSGILPFVKYFLGEVKVVPILLKRGFSEKDSDILVSNLADMVDEDTVVIAAVDFSHYLKSDEAIEKDKVTQKIMEDFDYQKLYLLDNDYLDSPSSIGVLLKLMQKLKAENSDILFHTNSGEMQKNNGIETTSYFSIAFFN